MSVAIGLEVRLLRERIKLSAKDLAERVGLSPSQMSRLESGQRRVDAVVLSKISRELGVHPSYFFDAAARAGTPVGGPGDAPAVADGDSQAGDEVEVAPPPPALEAPAHLGKLIRAERHRKHVTPDELGARIGKARTFVLDLEAGTNAEFVTGELLGKVARALKLEPEVLFEAQRAEVRDLRRAVARLERAHTDRTLGELILGPAEGQGTRRGLPLVAGEDGGLPARFDGRTPTERAVDYLYVPGLRVAAGFACAWSGGDMEAPGGGSPSFRSGDVLVFASDREARHRDFVLAALPGGRSVFRQLFVDPRGKVRLHALNPENPPLILDPTEVTELFPLVARVATV